ncbi:MAG TPA: protein kinase, partial [Gemmatimonadaceae bacterium]|nr:protein kinase [Gemmatimonadaceae bacterium]
MDEQLEHLKSALADRYRVEREVGRGGMATVYLAEDLRHQRRVALKVLRADLASSVGAARFLREIAIAAQLQHPHILPLHDSGELRAKSPGNGGGPPLLYYVMPYVEGESLRERVAREGPLPAAEAVRLLAEIVDALVAAHAQGIVHRDMKPDNVMLSGRHALVTDFGVAKALSEATGSAAMTTTGIALGTPAYMAPEQATADPAVDHRADIYAVGVIAYELLTGKPPFEGSPHQVLAAHVTGTPEPVGQRRPDLPPALEHAIMKCLAKNPAERWQRSEDLLAALEAVATPSGGSLPASAQLPGTRARRRLTPWIAGLAAVAVGALALALWMSRQAAPLLSIGRTEVLTSDPGLEISPAISPDGRVVAYAGGTSARMRIFLRDVGGERALALSDDTATVESQPAWSPDGGQVLFLSRGGVYVASSLGGRVRAVVAPDATTPAISATWSPDGREIAVVRSDSVLVFAVDGGAPRFVVSGTELTSCDWSPAGVWLACVSGNPRYLQPGAFFGNVSPSRIVLIHMTDGRTRPVTDSASLYQHPRWSGEGDRLYFISNREGTRDIYVLAIRSDGRPRGEPARVSFGLNVHSFSFDRESRRLTYAVYQERSNLWSLPIPSRPPVNTDGAVQLTSGSEVIEVMRAFPGGWVLFESDRQGSPDIYRIRVDGGTAERLTSEPGAEFAATLSPDGSEITYHSFRAGTRDVILRRLSDGAVQQLTNTGAEECCPVWSPDGRTLSTSEFAGEGGIYLMHRDSAGAWGPRRQILPRGFLHSWSPDGRTIAVATGRTIRGA